MIMHSSEKSAAIRALREEEPRRCLLLERMRAAERQGERREKRQVATQDDGHPRNALICAG